MPRCGNRLGFVGVRPFSAVGYFTMSADLEELIERSKKIQPSAGEREKQRRSFAYGNTHFENANITRDTIDKAADKLASDGSPKD
jgi:hypothetical protein